MSTGYAQLGKSGVTDNFILSLQALFKKNDSVRISVLKNAGHERETVKGYSQEILDKLGVYYTVKIIGFTIIVKKWRKPRR